MRTPIVVENRLGYDPRTLNNIFGRHRLFVHFLVKHKPIQGAGVRSIGRLIVWGWAPEPDCRQVKISFIE